MTGTATALLKVARALELTTIDKAVAVLWWHGIHAPGSSRTVKELCEEIEAAGYARPNVTRLAESLKKDRRTLRSGHGYRLTPAAADAAAEIFSPFLKSRPVVATDSVLPFELFKGTRGYIEKVVLQINGSYDGGMYDCCAVMARRLPETLIIETYEAKGWQHELLGSDGHYLMFSGLLSHIERETRFKVGRAAIDGLRSFKRLGDASAHNRRFNARKGDIDPLATGMRMAAEELLHLSELIK